MFPEEKIERPRPDEFMIRPCHWYDEEFYECERPKGRFHQYFIFGKFLECDQWQIDSKNCKLWKQKKDEKAYEELIESEKQRRLERLKGYVENDVWKKRDKPPDNWNAPLPEWLEKKNEDTYLALKARDIKNGIVNDRDVQIYNTCSIL